MLKLIFLTLNIRTGTTFADLVEANFGEHGKKNIYYTTITKRRGNEIYNCNHSANEA
jgi:hypothetical protein